MLETEQIIAGLEIGTSKVCVVVGELIADGQVRIIGVGQAPSRGVRKGELVDAAQATIDVREAICNAEEMANVEIRSLYLGVTGAHIRCRDSRGVKQIMSDDREITEEDVDDVVHNARVIDLPADSAILHGIRQSFVVDDLQGVPNPVGMVGSRLEANVHIIYGNKLHLNNPIHLVNSLQFEIAGVVFNGFAAALALLSNEQKEMGALVIDLGGGVTNYVAYADGAICHSGVLAVGGDHVSNDLAYGLKIPLSLAEKLKLAHATAIMPQDVKGRTLPINSDTGQLTKTINLEHLHRIITLRLAEIFQIIAQDVGKTGLLDYLRGGVVLCGGGAHIREIQRLAESTFQLPARIGRATGISGIKDALDQPEFATGIGLVKFGSLKQKTAKISRARSFIQKYFPSLKLL